MKFMAILELAKKDGFNVSVPALEVVLLKGRMKRIVKKCERSYQMLSGRDGESQ